MSQTVDQIKPFSPDDRYSPSRIGWSVSTLDAPVPAALSPALEPLIVALEHHRRMFFFVACTSDIVTGARAKEQLGWQRLEADNYSLHRDEPGGETLLWDHRGDIESVAQEIFCRKGPPRDTTGETKVTYWDICGLGASLLEETAAAISRDVGLVAKVIDATLRKVELGLRFPLDASDFVSLKDLLRSAGDAAHDEDSARWYPSLVSWSYLQRLDKVIAELKQWDARCAGLGFIGESLSLRAEATSSGVADEDTKGDDTQSKPGDDKPKAYCFNWREILETLELKNNKENRSRVRQLHKLRLGPIIFEGQGKQPTVEKNKLIGWWNECDDRCAELNDRQRDKTATVAGSYNYGRDGVVVPDIVGSIKKRRNGAE